MKASLMADLEKRLSLIKGKSIMINMINAKITKNNIEKKSEIEYSDRQDGERIALETDISNLRKLYFDRIKQNAKD
jgi:hypothetical protein